MSELKIIAWFLWLIAAMYLVFMFVGIRALCNMFPEGKKAWHLPAQLTTLAFFAAAVLLNPWGAP